MCSHSQCDLTPVREVTAVPGDSVGTTRQPGGQGGGGGGEIPSTLALYYLLLYHHDMRVKTTTVVLSGHQINVNSFYD